MAEDCTLPSLLIVILLPFLMILLPFLARVNAFNGCLCEIDHASLEGCPSMLLWTAILNFWAPHGLDRSSSWQKVLYTLEKRNILWSMGCEQRLPFPCLSTCPMKRKALFSFGTCERSILFTHGPLGNSSLIKPTQKEIPQCVSTHKSMCRQSGSRSHA